CAPATALAHRRRRMGNHREPGDRREHLGARRAHPLALACREHDGEAGASLLRDASPPPAFFRLRLLRPHSDRHAHSPPWLAPPRVSSALARITPPSRAFVIHAFPCLRKAGVAVTSTAVTANC